MRKVAMALAVCAGLCSLAIGLYLLIVDPDIWKHWMGVWYYEMGIGHTFSIHSAENIFGVLALIYAAIMFAGAFLMRRYFVGVGIALMALDMIACGIIAICPDPKLAVFVWAVPGLLLAAIGFLLGMELQRTRPSEVLAEF